MNAHEISPYSIDGIPMELPITVYMGANITQNILYIALLARIV
jgi:hypothetical protein